MSGGAEMQVFDKIISDRGSRYAVSGAGVADAAQVRLHSLLSVTRQLGIIPRAPTYNLPHYSMYTQYSPKCSQFRTYSAPSVIFTVEEYSFAIIAGDSD